MSRIKKIVTHAGTFHADELCALALLHTMFPDAPVERTYTPSEDDFNDVGVIVLDIGRRYEPELNNFDHHHDAELPATNMLVLRHFLPDDSRLPDMLESLLFRYISDVDTGKIVETFEAAPTINQIVRNCNNLPEDIAFDTARSLMKTAFEAAWFTASRRIEAEDIWKDVTITGQVAVHDSPKWIVGWEEIADPTVRFLVKQNLRGGYQITSRDSRLHPIPPDPRQTFLHNSRFTASYRTLEDAVDHAMSI